MTPSTPIFCRRKRSSIGVSAPGARPRRRRPRFGDNQPRGSQSAVRLMSVPVPDRPYWWDTVPAPGPFADSPPASADVAIIGAGYTGLAAARVLASRGARVVVLEREHVGWGASSRNGGQVLTGLKLDAASLVSRFGESRARRLFAIGMEAVAFLERLIGDERI